MIFQTMKKGWHILSTRERVSSFYVLIIVVVSAFLSALMVASIVPFLSVLGDPSQIEKSDFLNRAYMFFEFTSVYGFLTALGGISIAVICIATVAQVLRSYAVSRFGMMRAHSLSFRLLSAYLRQPYEFFLNRHSGEMGTRILSESQHVVGQFYLPVANVVASLFSTVAIVGLLLWVDFFVTIVCFFVLGCLYGGAFLFSKRLLAILGDRRVIANMERYRVANEAIGGVKDIKLLGREASYLGRFMSPSLNMARIQVIASVIAESPSYILQGIVFAGMIVLGLFLLNPAGIESGAALGEILPLLGIFAFAGQRLIPELQRVYNGLAQMQYGGAAIDAIYEDIFLSTSGRTLPDEVPQALPLCKELTLSGVTYRYPNADRAGLRDVSVTIGAGEKVGVVGSTGAGKSTLADLLLGLIRQESGSVRVDDIELTSENIRNWQQAVGYVPQDIFLVDATIKENIALGLAEAEIDLEQVKAACRVAQLDRFIECDLTSKYDTLVGERGVRLSGGQKQRIGIARALYHGANFLVFDEATSALDNLTEQEVMSAVNALSDDKTILMIAHRLSTLEACDRIIVLEDGAIAGVGRWDELIESNHAFQSIAKRR